MEEALDFINWLENLSDTVKRIVSKLKEGDQLTTVEQEYMKHLFDVYEDS